MTIDANGHASGPDSVRAAAALTELDSLCRYYAAEIWMTAFRYVACRQDAEDAMQDAFEALLTTTAQIDNPVNWLKTVVRRKAWRSRTRRPEEFFADLTEGWSVDNTTPEHRVLQQSTVQELLKAVEEVSAEAPRYFQYLADGYTIPEIATMCDTPVETVRKRIQRLRWRLSEQTLGQKPAQDVTVEASRQHRATSEGHLLVETVAVLPARQQEVLGLALDGHRPRAIATILGITSGTARVNLHYAKKKIAETVGCPIDEVMTRLHQLGELMIRLAS